MVDQQKSDAAIITGGSTQPPTFADAVVKPLLGKAVRHVLTTAGGALLAHGFITSTGLSQFIGFGMTAAGFAWSWWNNSGRTLLMQDVANLRAILQARADAARKSQAGSAQPPSKRP